MRTANRIIAVCVSAAMAFQMLVPSTEVFAQEIGAVSAYATNDALDEAGAQGAQRADSETGGSESADSETSGSETGDANGAQNGGDAAETEATGEADGADDESASDDDAASSETGESANDDSGVDGESVASAQAEGEYAINDVNGLRNALGESNVKVDEGTGTVTEVTISVNKDMIMLSNTNPSVYQTATIVKGGQSGASFDVTSTQDGYAFRGFGSADCPFEGAFKFADSPITLNRTLFNNVTWSDQSGALKLAWKGTDAQPIVASKISGNGKTLTTTVTVANKTLASPLLGELTGALTLDATYAVESGASFAVSINSALGNTGLLVNTVAADGSLALQRVSLPENKGALSIAATKEGANAGGLIGECGAGATVTIKNTIDVSAFSVAGKNASGGFIGKATNLNLNFEKSASVKPAKKVGDASATYAGGAIGDVSFASSFEVTPDKFVFDDDATIELGAIKRAGGLFGRLDVTKGDVTIQGGTYKSKLSTGSDGGGSADSRGSYGGIAGNVCSTATDAIHALNVSGNANVEVERAENGKLCYVGGIAGYMGENGGTATQKVAVVLDGVAVKLNGSAYAYTENGKFGGAIGVVDTGNALDLRNFKLTSGDPVGKDAQGKDAQGGSAGIAGSVWEGVVKLSGTTDLSGVTFADNEKTAQLVYQNSNALIFATGSGSDNGWKYIRSANGSRIDDIYDYGEVIRLGSEKGLNKDLVKLDPNTHVLDLGTPLQKTGEVFKLSSVDDFAKLAITWQSSGYFAMAEGATSGNVSSLSSSTIEIAGTIDLSNTGFTGLTKDPALGLSWTESANNWTFTGTLTGSGSVKLAVGEPYGMREGKALDSNDTSDGNGKIYRHGYLGLFANVGGNAKIENVTIGGFMRFDNGSGVDAGALSAAFNGASLTVAGAKFKTSVTYDNTANDKPLNVGGILGSVSGAGTVEFNGSTESAASITSRVQDQSNPRVGGAIGFVAGDSTATISAAGLAVTGSISIPDFKGQALAGGFIGFIQQGGELKTVNITGLSLNDFSLSINASNAGTKYAGGLLGASWGNAEVTIGSDGGQASTYALTANRATVSATNATEVGGLAYAASGHWVINNKAIDLTGATFNASSANTFGLMICRGSRCPFGVESYSGFYLEDRAYWGDDAEGGAYKVEGATINTSAATFDEWVGNGVETSRKLIDGDWNAIVSLHTKAEKLDMSDNPENDNSYKNRTTYGQSHQTNGNTRYYYNLDRAYNKVGDLSKSYTSSGSAWFTTPEELLLWCAVRYAPPEVKKFIVGKNDGMVKCFDGNLLIGSNLGTAESNEISLEGYSYYPTNLNSNATMRVKNATVAFCYSAIKAEQSGNKLNSEATQHENMHTALVRSITGGTLDVKNVKLQGTVGRVVNDSGSPASSSGIFGCRYVQGSESNSLVTVTFDGVVLDGIAVDGAGDEQYAPLLINCINTYADVTVKNVSATDYDNGAKAASSLLGKLGGENAELVTANFSDNISLPSLRGGGIFTHASLLESFGYKKGTSGSSASYIFYKSESEAGKATYGSEIDANGSNNEYVGDQLWYYDEGTYKQDEGLVVVGDKKANASNPVFGEYLPYVAKGKSGDEYHEMKVNQRIANIKVGCGTYADPYALTSEFEIKTVADYISNKGSAADEWEVTITKDQSQICARRDDTNPNTDNEVTYKYKQSSGTWISTSNSNERLSNDTMHTYLQSAYYSIEPKNKEDGTVVNSIKLDTATFTGFGNEANPFRGVIVGNLKNGVERTKLVIKGGGTFPGLIAYSYGSVVKDLDIEYQGGDIALKYDNKKSAAAVPKTFFGGVIGCIMGGDNIIDGVNVTSPQESSVQRVSSLGFNELATAATGITTDSLLIPVGGYVGAICGGGVIFRNTTKNSWRKNAKTGTNDLYNNPYVGRVIDGYAFSEGWELDNSDDNYKVNELVKSDTPCVQTGEIVGKYRDGNNQEAITTTVNNAQGLLVLSAIISSGAGAGACYSTYNDTNFGTFSGSKAYAGRTTAATGSYKFGNDSYGKVRNASYDYVGKVVGDVNDPSRGDESQANNDDTKAPGRQNSKSQGPLDNFTDGESEGNDSVNSPYLVKNYATWQTGYVCAAKAAGMDLQFVANQEYDMRGYGTGYTGLSGRYYSNACYSARGADRDRIVPLVACINGNGAQLILKSDVKQYLNDDYFLQSWGGLFSAVTFANDHAATSIGNNGDSVVQNLQLGVDGTESDSKQSSVSLTCVKDANGTEATLIELKDSKKSSAALDNTTKLPHLGVGAFAGMTANRDSLASSGVYSNVSIRNCRVTGPSMVGGLLGNSGWAARRTDTTNNRMTAFGDNGTVPSSVKLKNCSYSNLAVSGAARVGGFVGAIGSGSDSGIWVTDSNVIVGQNSTISSTADECIVGGAFGLAWSKIQVNVPQGEGDSYGVAQMLGVTVRNNYAVASVGKDESDNDKLRGTGGIIGNAQVGCDVRNVRVAALSEDAKVEVGGNVSGKIVQCVGGIVGQLNDKRRGDTSSSYSFDGIAVENATMKAVEGSGGLVGTIAAGINVDCSNVVISNVELGNTYSGGLAGGIKNSNAVLTASNVKVQNCTFKGDACSAISGDGKGTFRLSNVLVYKNRYQDKGNQGLVLGKTWCAGSTKDLRGLYAAGLDIVPEDGKKTSDLPDYVASAANKQEDLAVVQRDIHKVSYVALADYNDVFTGTESAGHNAGDGSSLYSDERNADGTMAAVSSASPYVTTNPVAANPTVKIAAGGTAYSLFGDGAAINTAATIQSDVEKAANSEQTVGSYAYTNIGGCDDNGNYRNANSYNKSSAQSTFNASNPTEVKDANGNQLHKVSDRANFNVLVVSGNDTTTVTDYLNLVTNGGFSDAVRFNPKEASVSSLVTAKAEVFNLVTNGNTQEFVKDEEASKSPALIVSGGGTDGMSFSASSDWDNDKGRFTLLTVTFNDGAGHKYKVQVPIVVKRVFEINFSATYSEGNNFNSNDYTSSSSAFDKHVLISSGDTMSGYLTWTYNQAVKGSEVSNVGYGWDTYLASGGAMKPLNKEITFEGSGDKGKLPNGTQLTLIDTADNNKEYRCVVGEDGVGQTSVKLTKFYTGEGEAKTYYKEKWLSEELGASAREDNASGVWVRLTDKEKENKTEADLIATAGVKIGDDYYRVKNTGDTTGPFYTLSASEGSVGESFFLVVHVPASNANNTVSVNGFTATNVDTPIHTNINYVLRKSDAEGNIVDRHQNTASTYSIASNYTHDLVDQSKTWEGNDVCEIVKSSATSYLLNMKVSDTITFDASQEYTGDDKLYYQLDSSLVKYDGSSIKGAIGYPSPGTQGTYSFYVTVGGYYYSWNGSSWEKSDTKAPVVSEPRAWQAGGSSTSLLLAAGAKGEALDLSGLRNIASQFTITMEASLTMSEDACLKGIEASQDGGKYTKPSYRASLSTHADTLATSSNTQYIPGVAGYYRRDGNASTIALEASDKSQLGINIDDLPSGEDGSIIALVGTYDISRRLNVEELLSEGKNVTYTLSLQRRNNEGSYDSVNGIGDYIDIAEYDKLEKDACSLSADKNSYVFTDAKAADSGFKTFAGNGKFMLSFRVKVKTDVEAQGHTYANYRLVLTAKLTGEGGKEVDIPANTDYVTYTLSRINTAGIGYSK